DLDACRRAHSPLIAWIRALICAEADPIHWTKSLSARSSNSFSCSLKMACLRNACVSIELSSWSENRRTAVLNAWILSFVSRTAFDRASVNGKEAATIGSGMEAIYLVPKWEFLHEPHSPAPQRAEFRPQWVQIMERGPGKSAIRFVTDSYPRLGGDSAAK